MSSQSEGKQYEVRTRCVIIKLVTCENCTEEQARADPFKYSVDELEIDMENWEVLSVREES